MSYGNEQIGNDRRLIGSKAGEGKELKKAHKKKMRRIPFDIKVIWKQFKGWMA
jgi:hypothetical protein